MNFLPDVEEALLKVGWYPGRQVEGDVLQKWYVFRWETAPGYCRIFPAAYRFLHEFGGLKIGYGTSTCLIDPLETAGIQDDMWPYEEWRLQTRLYPLGMMETGYVLHVDTQGRFWSLPTPVLLGTTLNEALANIMIPGRLASIPPNRENLPPLDQKEMEIVECIISVERHILTKIKD